jgi:hypothetical protein
MITLEKNNYGLNATDNIKRLEEEVRELRSFVLGFIPTESFNDYESPKKLKMSLEKALQDYQKGNFSVSL